MKKLFPRFMPLIAMLCVSLFFSCSPDVDPPSPPPEQSGNSTDNYCVYSASQQCFNAGTQKTCPAGGELSSFCPFGTPSSNSSPSSPSGEQNPNEGSPTNPTNPNNYSYYCVYAAQQQCFAASSDNCPAGGELSSFCPPFGNAGGSSDSQNNPSNPNNYYCVYADLQQCFAANSQTSCPGNGQLSVSCPSFGNPNSSASVGGKSSSGNQQATISSSSINNPTPSSTGTVVNPNPPATGGSGPVSYYGELKASGNKLIGSKTGTAVQVRGVSLFWSNTNWGGEKFFTAATVNAMADDWKAEVIRVPIGYAESGGYSTDPSNLTRVKTAIDAAIAKGVYVIIDWHSHNAHNELTAANSFFSSMAQTYGSKDNVIFEIYNEPKCSNGEEDGKCPGGYTSWDQIKTYATNIISTIRQYSDNLILVGTPKWDQNVNVAANSPISASNIAYVFHFYAVDHTRALFESNVSAVLNAGYPVFVSEYGTVEASGDGAHSAANTDAWHTYMDNNKISSCAWSVNDKAEAASFFKPGFNMSNWTNTSSMTASGQYIFNKLRTYANSATWRGSGTTPSSSAAVVVSSSSIASGGISATRCKDGSGRDYFCEWGYASYSSTNPGCFAIDPRYAEPAGQTCSELISDCNLYGSLFINSTEGESMRCDGTRVSGSTPTPTPTPTPTSLYCDFGYETTAGGGCFPIDYESECNTADGGKVATSCGRTDLIYCNWGPRYYDPYHEDCKEDYCGGCYIVPTSTQCTRDYGKVVSRCPADTL